jgi:chorismate mutase
MDQPDVVRMIVSVPVDLRAWIKAQASRNRSSMTAIIIRAVREDMDDDEQQRAKAAG